MKKEPSFIKRYGTFILVGFVIEAVRLGTFRYLENSVSPDIANVFSLPLSIAISFTFHGGITWRDRPGRWWEKLGRFGTSKWTTWIIKGALFPFWWRVQLLSCPFYSITHDIVDLITVKTPSVGQFMHELFTCGWMSLALMDLIIALTIGFLTHDQFSFWKEDFLPKLKARIKKI